MCAAAQSLRTRVFIDLLLAATPPARVLRSSELLGPDLETSGRLATAYDLPILLHKSSPNKFFRSDDIVFATHSQRPDSGTGTDLVRKLVLLLFFGISSLTLLSRWADCRPTYMCQLFPHE